jgi:hypothetical protein
VDPSKAWQVVPDGQTGAASLQIGRHTPAPLAPPTGTTQLDPAAQPVQPASPLHPWFCVHVAPTAPDPGHAQSVVSSV